MRQIFQSFWIGETISPYEALAMRSFIDHGHRFHLYCYSRELSVPRGVELRDASTILPKDKCFAYKAGFGAGSFSACSNLFRYLLLRRYGGWWVDTDVICLTSRISEPSSFFALEDDDFINGAVLYFDPSDPLLDHCLREALGAGGDVKWGQIGPRLITRKARELGRFAEAKPASSCYALHWSVALQLLDPRHRKQLVAATRESMMVHLWNEIFRQAGICKTLLPPRGSYLRHLADLHPVHGWSGQYVVPKEATLGVPQSLQVAGTGSLHYIGYWFRDLAGYQMRRRISKPHRSATWKAARASFQALSAG